MLVELPIVWIVLLNVLAWLVIQLGLACVMTRIPAAQFNPRSSLARLWDWERSGRGYEKFFAIKRWKDRLPDAASWFKGGFPKADLQMHTPEFLERFLRETWRGELSISRIWLRRSDWGISFELTRVPGAAISAVSSGTALFFSACFS